MPSRLPAERGSAASTTSLRRFTATRADPEDYRSLFIRCCFLRQPAVLSIRGYFRHRPLRLRGTLPRPPSASSAAPSSSHCSEPSPLWPPDVCIVRQNTSPAAVQPLAGLALTYVEGPWAYPGGASEPAGVAWYPQSDRDKSAPSPRDAASGVRGTQETPYTAAVQESR